MVRLVAEIGCNHRGDMAIARELIGVAAKVRRVDAVKFQKRSNRELLSPPQYEAPHPVPGNAYGPTYGAHREALEFTPDQSMPSCRPAAPSRASPPRPRSGT
ncbi:hypothetical protein ACFQY5_12550 [Paeniroseomonas aquatica]|uniref:N-acetylneuraminic acid synthase N-terminal domain-containing protein n=1 Tax=Paeniroseomonas aquatica TaxID=373043 RepID=A0ABT8AD04_9PROT|nr:hypothetical protein [Paeniroseomonas aquatica]MDN3567654.1 hypothetical protein [Paeniroseomonas aquatica]